MDEMNSFNVKSDGTCHNGMNHMKIVWPHIYSELSEVSICHNPKMRHKKSNFPY
jgi:hypothetical protein